LIVSPEKGSVRFCRAAAGRPRVKIGSEDSQYLRQRSCCDPRVSGLFVLDSEQGKT